MWVEALGSMPGCLLSYAYCVESWGSCLVVHCVVASFTSPVHVRAVWLTIVSYIPVCLGIPLDCSFRLRLQGSLAELELEEAVAGGLSPPPTPAATPVPGPGPQHAGPQPHPPPPREPAASSSASSEAPVALSEAGQRSGAGEPLPAAPAGQSGRAGSAEPADGSPAARARSSPAGPSSTRGLEEESGSPGGGLRGRAGAVGGEAELPRWSAVAARDGPGGSASPAGGVSPGREKSAAVAGARGAVTAGRGDDRVPAAGGRGAELAGARQVPGEVGAGGRSPNASAASSPLVAGASRRSDSKECISLGQDCPHEAMYAAAGLGARERLSQGQ